MVATKPTMSIFTGTQHMGNIFLEQEQITVKFVEFNIPGSDIDGNQAGNLLGKTRFIMVQGAHDGSGFNGTTQNDKLFEFIFNMEQWVRGTLEGFNIQSAEVYTDSFAQAHSVKCFDWTWKRSFSDPSRILYTLLMHEV
jgi:hypothetical protein